LVVALLGALVAASALLAATALARRAPTRSEAKAIRAAVTRYERSSSSAIPRDSRITRIVVSTVDRRYALVTLRSPSAGTERALLRRGGVRRGRVAATRAKRRMTRQRQHTRHRRPGRPSRPASWRVLGAGPGAPGCSTAPAAVLTDLFGAAGSCAPNGY
jgi:hypothetical protein